MNNAVIATLAIVLALGAWASTRDSDQREATIPSADSNRAADPDADSDRAAKPIRISRVGYDQSGPRTGSNAHLNREWVAIRSFGQRTRQLKGWTLRDRAGHVYRFPSFELRPNTTVKVHTGDGRRTRHDLYWRTEYYVWNGSGDVAILRQNDGRLIDRCRWGNGDGLRNCC